MLTALDLKVNGYGSPEEIRGHIASCLERGLPEVSPAICSHDGTFIVVGSGPSLPQYVDALRAEQARGRPICAINHAHDFLIEHGIEPTFFLTLDPRPRANHHLKYLCEQTIYLMASRCHPEMFDRLKDQKVLVWHAFADHDHEQTKDLYKTRVLLVGGGTTSGIRAIYVAYLLGFRKFVLYGMDSCLAPDGMTKRFNGDGSGITQTVRVGEYRGDTEYCDPNAKAFICNVAMAQQGKDFHDCYHHMPDASFDVMGDGLLAAIVEQRKSMGLRT